MKDRIGNDHPISCVNREDLDHAMLSLQLIEKLVVSPSENTYWNALASTVQKAYNRPVEAYSSFVTLYNIPSRWIHDDFQAFIDPNNSVAQILQAHFIAIQAILTPILYLERIGFEGINAPTAVMSWIESIHWNLPYYLRGYLEWPRQVSRYSALHFAGQTSLSCSNE